MKINTAEFITGAETPERFPELGLPEIAFAGRSNVGKSSLINSIVNRKKLALISSTPGKTKQINFFVVDNKWSFADMPGFGYAAVAKSSRANWLKLNYSYLESRENLNLVCALIDSRHDPMDTDLAFIEWLENHERKYLIILTKCDKISSKAVNERKEQIEGFVKNSSFCDEVLAYSSVKDMGRNELIAIIKRVTSL